VREGDELARVYLRREDEGLAALFAGCFTVADEGQAPVLIPRRISHWVPPVKAAKAFEPPVPADETEA